MRAGELVRQPHCNSLFTYMLFYLCITAEEPLRLRSRATTKGAWGHAPQIKSFTLLLRKIFPPEWCGVRFILSPQAFDLPTPARILCPAKKIIHLLAIRLKIFELSFFEISVNHAKCWRGFLPM